MRVTPGTYHLKQEVRQAREEPRERFPTRPLLKQAVFRVSEDLVVIEYTREDDGSRWRVTYEVIGGS